MSLTFAIPDLHGRADLLALALGAITERASGAKSTVIFLGDYVGKGGDTSGVLARMVRGATGGETWICLKGNHEAMMVAALTGKLAFEAWLEKGGDAILASYGVDARRKNAMAAVPAAHLDWLSGLRSIHVDAYRVYVHAGLDPSFPLGAQNERDLLWKRYADDDPGGHEGRVVVHGHRPFADGPRIWSGRVDLDTLAWSTGRLAVGVFEDDRPGGPIDILEVGRSRAAVRWHLLRERFSALMSVAR